MLVFFSSLMAPDWKLSTIISTWSCWCCKILHCGALIPFHSFRDMLEIHFHSQFSLRLCETLLCSQLNCHSYHAVISLKFRRSLIMKVFQAISEHIKTLSAVIHLLGTVLGHEPLVSKGCSWLYAILKELSHEPPSIPVYCSSFLP